MAEERLIELEVIYGPMDGHIFAMTSETFTIGRDPENEISLPHDRRISKSSHVEVTANGEGEWSVIKSGRGRFHLNGKRISGPVKLTPGHKVELGKTTLMVNRTAPRRYGEVDEDPLKPRDRSGNIPIHRI